MLLIVRVKLGLVHAPRNDETCAKDENKYEHEGVRPFDRSVSTTDAKERHREQDQAHTDRE